MSGTDKAVLWNRRDRVAPRRSGVGVDPRLVSPAIMKTPARLGSGGRDERGWTRAATWGALAVLLGGALVVWSAEEAGKPAAGPMGLGVPVGTLLPYAGGDAAALEAQGWMVCDGRELVDRDFPALSVVLGRAWGGESARGLFRLPDLRGRFIRGMNGEATGPLRDADRDTRMASAPGGNTGNAVGSLQEEGVGPHTHPLVGVGDAVGAGADSGWVRLFATKLPDDSAPLVRSEGSVTAGAGAETRPVNVYVNWIIRVR